MEIHKDCLTISLVNGHSYDIMHNNSDYFITTDIYKLRDEILKCCNDDYERRANANKNRQL